MKYRWQRHGTFAKGARAGLSVSPRAIFGTNSIELFVLFWIYMRDSVETSWRPTRSPHSMKKLRATPPTCSCSAARRRMAHCLGARGQAGRWPALRSTPCRGFTP